MAAGPRDLLDIAADEVRRLLVEDAASRRFTTYGKLAQRIKTLPVEPGSSVLSELLARVTLDEFRAGHPLLTAIITNKDWEPGRGFYKLTRRLGYECSDEVEFWLRQVQEVFAFDWSSPSPKPVASDGGYQQALARTHRRGDDVTVDELLAFFAL